MKQVLAQTRIEIALTLRRGESLLATVGIPAGILVFFSTVDVLPHGEGSAVDFLAPGVLALAVVSTAMVSLGIATGFERQAGVLRRLGVTPLGRGGLLLAKTMAILLVELLQVIVLTATAAALGWRPGACFYALPLILLGTAAFAGIGLTLAGTLRAEANLAAANGLFIAFMLMGGIVVPVSRLPSPLQAASRVLPAEPLATALRQALTQGTVSTRPLVTLAAWAVGSLLLAAATFRWD
jgi:ABC-2 type transport system permease protein